MTDKPTRSARVEKFVGDHPLLLSIAALSVSISVEMLQQYPEVLPFGHEVGEVARNLGYGVAAAFAFNWIMVDVPHRREEKRILDTYWGEFESLATSGAALLARYRTMAPEGDYDTQTEEGMRRFLAEIPLIESTDPDQARVQVISNGVAAVRSDPFAISDPFPYFKTHERTLTPFLHHVKPEVSYATLRLLHFRHLPGNIGPIHVAPGNLDREFRRIWEFLNLSRQLRHALLKHYPGRTFSPSSILVHSPRIRLVPINESDL